MGAWALVTLERDKTMLSKIRRFGPTRVVTEVQGEAVRRADTPDQALMNYGIVPIGVFIRNDGWSLGFDMRTARAAFELWKGEWVSVLDLTTGRIAKF